VGNYTRVFFDAESPLILRSLNALEARLPATHFFRASRTHIVNINHIVRVEDYFGGGLFVHLKGQEQGIEISRRRAIQFRKAMTL
jgi:two-component system LytT family response regulator